MPNDRFQVVGTCLEDKFQVDRVIAEGGFAVVYFGRHLSLDRPIALKILKTPGELNDRARQDFIAKFRLEGKTIARLSHVNIIQVIDFGVSTMPSGETAPWMVLEWLTGRSLEKDLEARRGQGGRKPQEVLNLLEPIFDALAHAHEEGVAHRDVKPANIMIVPTKRGEILKLVDFGIVKIMDKDERADGSFAPTRSTLTAHTPAYAAPEQITGLKTGPWTDVHALALIVTELMTDQPPYKGKNITTLLREILSPSRPTPAQRQVDAGPWESVLVKALALEPSERFSDAGEFLAALKHALPSSIKSISGVVTDQDSELIDEDPYSQTLVRPQSTREEIPLSETATFPPAKPGRAEDWAAPPFSAALDGTDSTEAKPAIAAAVGPTTSQKAAPRVQTNPGAPLPRPRQSLRFGRLFAVGGGATLVLMAGLTYLAIGKSPSPHDIPPLPSPVPEVVKPPDSKPPTTAVTPPPTRKEEVTKPLPQAPPPSVEIAKPVPQASPSPVEIAEPSRERPSLQGEKARPSGQAPSPAANIPKHSRRTLPPPVDAKPSRQSNQNDDKLRRDGVGGGVESSSSQKKQPVGDPVTAKKRASGRKPVQQTDIDVE